MATIPVATREIMSSAAAAPPRRARRASGRQPDDPAAQRRIQSYAASTASPVPANASTSCVRRTRAERSPRLRTRFRRWSRACGGPASKDQRAPPGSRLPEAGPVDSGAVTEEDRAAAQRAPPGPLDRSRWREPVPDPSRRDDREGPSRSTRTTRLLICSRRTLGGRSQMIHLLPAARAKPRRAESVHIPFRCSWTNWTAIAPSPTAEVKRFTEPDRTSPAANTPGRLVSSRNGCR